MTSAGCGCIRPASRAGTRRATRTASSSNLSKRSRFRVDAITRDRGWGRAAATRKPTGRPGWLTATITAPKRPAGQGTYVFTQPPSRVPSRKDRPLRAHRPGSAFAVSGQIPELVLELLGTQAVLAVAGG